MGALRRLSRQPAVEPAGHAVGQDRDLLRRHRQNALRGLPRHPDTDAAARVVSRAGSGQYPLSLNTAHPTNRLHSQLDNTPLRAKYAVADREAILIHPQDAQPRGISGGDLVRAFNDRGQIPVGAVVSEDVRPGVVRISEGARFDPADPAQPGSLCKNGNVNCLTFDIGSSSGAGQLRADGSCRSKYRGRY